MNVIINILAVIGAVCLLCTVVGCFLLVRLALRDKREEEARELIAHTIRYNPYLSSRLDTLDLKIGSAERLHERLDTMGRRQTELWEANGKRLLAIETERAANYLELKKELEALKGELV